MSHETPSPVAEGYRVPPLEIGRLIIPVPVILAPMAGYTDAAMRSLCCRFGAGLTFTEVVNAQGLLHDSRLTFHLLETFAGERPVAAHLYGSNAEDLARAACHVEQLGRFDVIDVNCGCPVRKIVAKGAGVALMKQPALVERIVRGIRDAVTLPVTIKTRLGLVPEEDRVMDVAAAAEQGGAAAVSVHARYASSHHVGPAQWDSLARIKQLCGIPVIGNGGIDTPQDAVEMFRETGVDGVMIGRAAVGNPWFFLEVRELLGQPLSMDEGITARRAVIEEHLRLLLELTEKSQRLRRRSRLIPDQAAALHFRGHLHKYLAGLPGWRTVRRSLQEMNSSEKIMAAVDSVLGGCPVATVACHEHCVCDPMTTARIGGVRVRVPHRSDQ
jgi:nifR3 family TIM-barrel protein